MANTRKVNGASSSSSNSLDYLFGPKNSPASTSSSTTGLFSSIFPPPHKVLGRDSHSGIVGSLGNNQVGTAKYGASGNSNTRERISTRDKSSIDYQSEIVEPSYLSSSIYYGGQEDYSPKAKTYESHRYFKKGGEDYANESDSNGVSRGNWWQGSLYY